MSTNADVHQTGVSGSSTTRSGRLVTFGDGSGSAQSSATTIGRLHSIAAVSCGATAVHLSEVELSRHLHEARGHEGVRAKPRRAIGVVVGQWRARVRHVVEVDAD